ncbi:MAG: dienelactone hydrolase family protein [Rhodocyclaceae bacterium]|nr:dienelactone hydrolase family protein [Rhodocyclaceae bacterium]
MSLLRHCGLLLLAVWGSAVAQVAERVRIDGPLALDAYFYAAQGGHGGRRPAVVAMHGCGGPFDREGAIGARHAMWAEHLSRQGYAVLLVDSFSARGIRTLCTIPNKDRPLRQADRVADAWAAKAWLAARDDVAAERIALLGWSHGAGTALYTLDETPANERPFAAAVAFYPGCTTLARRPEPYRPTSPLMILIGEADDWTPAASCRALASRSPQVVLKLYPGAYHDFDNPGGKLRVRSEVPNGVNPGQGVTVGPDPEAREDALRRVTAYLAEKLG